MLETFFPNTTNQALTQYNQIVKQINRLEPDLQKLSDLQLQKQTSDLQNKLRNKDVSKDQVLVQAFALVREATVRVLGLRHFDVQLLGGLILNDGKIAEMKTGEGKTLVALLPTFFNALYGKGVHVVTVNDYLARRDAEYVGRVHKFLGLNVGLIQEDMEPAERKQNYLCDITYVTNNELGFDYLRDNMAFTSEEIVQRPFFYCVVDEVDSILIDEARTPLIISGSMEASTQKYLATTRLVASLKKDIHYATDEKNQNVMLLEEGISFCEQALNVSDLYAVSDPWMPYILNSVKAKELFTCNTHYIVNSDNEIVIVDEFTGRTMVGRRWSDGLHQAVEAKEGLPIQDEGQTVASITYQNLFLLFDKLSGMTGTALTEEVEFENIYNLRVIPVPTNRPIKRKDFPDLIYKNQYLKWQAIANECRQMNSLGRPVLVGTTTIEKSELLAALLSEYQLPYQLLNARPENTENESGIIVQAGCKSAITIATNMAGRGTDIVLGGNTKSLTLLTLQDYFTNRGKNPYDVTLKSDDSGDNNFKQLADLIPLDLFPESIITYDQAINYVKTNCDSSSQLLANLEQAYDVVFIEKQKITNSDRVQIQQLGGLHVIGTERHESRRIDNQLRGRAGRQGDPGSSQFFLSLEDKLLRIFGGEKIASLMQNIGFQESVPIQSSFLTQSLESAQKKVESYYFDIRKKLFEYDQALNKQRNGIYAERRRILEVDTVYNWIIEYAERSLYDVVLFLNQSDDESTKLEIFQKVQYLLGMSFDSLPAQQQPENLVNFFHEQFRISYALKEAEFEFVKPGLIREYERSMVLQQIDIAWKEHLQKIIFLKEVIGWRAYGQKDPLTEYKKEAFNFFVIMLTQIRHRVTFYIMRSTLISEL